MVDLVYFNAFVNANFVKTILAFNNGFTINPFAFGEIRYFDGCSALVD